MRTISIPRRSRGRTASPLPVLLAGLLGWLAAVPWAAPAIAEPEVPTAPATATPVETPEADKGDSEPLDVLQLDDVPELLVPVRPRTSREEDHVRALALFAAARVAEQKQDYETALRNYQRTFRFDPSAVAALREIVPLAFNLGWQEEGVRYALLLAERDPTDAGLLRRLALYLTEDGESERALRLYEKALELRREAGEEPSAETVAMWMEMGRLYYVAEQFDDAARYFAKVDEALKNPEAYDLPPKVQSALLKRPQLTYQLFGEAFLEAGEVDAARAAFESAQAAEENEGQHLFNLARVEAAKKRPAQALAKLEAYFEGKHAKQGTAPYEVLQELLEELGQEDQLIARLEKYHEADPENVPLAYFLAERYREAGDYDKAGPLYQALVERREQRTPIEAVRGLVDVRHKQQDAAKLLDVLGQTVGRGRSLSPLGEVGEELIADQEVAGAVVDEAQRRLAAAPDQADYDQMMAAAFLALGIEKLEAAEKFFDAALEAESAEPAQALVAWGLELFMKGHYERAAKIFKRALEEEGPTEDNPALYFYLAGALEMSGQTDEAIEQARKAAELEEDSARFASRAAWILFHAKRYDEARKEYLALLEKFDKDRESPEVREVMRDARLVLSNMDAIEGNLDEAEEWLEQVLDEFPEDPGAMNDLGYLWADADKHLDLALSMIEVAVAGEPANMAYRDSLGWVLFRLGRYDEAVAELKVAASAENPDGVILDHLAQALAKRGDAEPAIEYWRRAVKAFENEGNVEMVEKVRGRLERFEKETASDADSAKPEQDSPAEKEPAQTATAPADSEEK